jgi:hypothetical protein
MEEFRQSKTSLASLVLTNTSRNYWIWLVNLFMQTSGAAGAHITGISKVPASPNLFKVFDPDNLLDEGAHA